MTHAPWDATVVPLSRATQAFRYVVPSAPQTGALSLGHAVDPSTSQFAPTPHGGELPPHAEASTTVMDARR